MRILGGSTLIVTIAAVVAIAARPVAAQPSASQRAFAPARQALDAAIAAHGGGDALRAIKDVQRTGHMTIHNQGQSLRPGTPYTTRAVSWRSVSDFARTRSRLDTVSTPAGGIRTPGRSVLRGDDGFNFAPLTNVVSPMNPGAVGASKAALRRDAATLLLTAASRADTLRDLGDAVFDKRPHRAITFADSDGAQIALYFDPQTRRLAKYETLVDHAILGDTVTEVVFADYRAVGGVQLPHRQLTRIAGELVQDLQFSEIKVNAGVADSMFEAPADALTARPTAGPTTVVASKLADGVYYLEGSTHHSLAVIQASSVLLVEAPQSDDRAQAVLAKLAELAPGKPVKTVVMTHYHYDHAGGVRALIGRGASVVTTAGNREFVTKLAAAPHTIKPDALSNKPAQPVIDIVAGKKVIGPVELYDIGPSPHIDELLVAYLPRDKILFVSDVFSVPVQGPMPPGTPSNRDFADKIKKLGIDVQIIAPGHGRIGTMKDLQKALDTPVPN